MNGGDHDGEIAAIKDKWYKIESFFAEKSSFSIIDEFGTSHSFPTERSDYFDLANPRTPIDADKMMEYYKEMWDMLDYLQYTLQPALVSKVKELLIKSKLDQ